MAFEHYFSINDHILLNHKPNTPPPFKPFRALAYNLFERR